jgi:hypothetical protein
MKRGVLGAVSAALLRTAEWLFDGVVGVAASTWQGPA